MRQITRRFLAGIILALMTGGSAWGIDWDFEVGGLYFSSSHFTNPENDDEIALVNPDDNPGRYQFPVNEGILVIPSEVLHDGKTYRVTCVAGISHQKSLKKLVLPATVKKVSHIYECPLLESIDFGGATWIGAVDNLPALRETVLQSGTTIKVQPGTFSEVGLESCVLNSNLDLGDMSFSYCDNLSYLNLSNAVFTGENVFNSFPKLTTLIMPETFTQTTLRDCFNWLPTLESVTLPKHIPEDFALIDCLKDCGQLLEIYCLSTTPISIKNASYAYANVGTTKIDTQSCIVYVPSGCAEAYRTHPSWNMFKNITEYDYASAEVINATKEQTVVYATGDTIYIEGDNSFYVYDLTGKVCPSAGLSPGIYIVKTSVGKTFKVKL